MPAGLMTRTKESARVFWLEADRKKRALEQVVSAGDFKPAGFRKTEPSRRHYLRNLLISLQRISHRIVELKLLNDGHVGNGPRQNARCS
jgi:hypothetical protein